MKVVPCVEKNFTDICSTVSYWDLSVTVLCDVVLEITSDSLRDVRRRLSERGHSTDSHVWGNRLACIQVIDNLVTGEEHHCVWVVLESLHDCECAVDVACIVTFPWRGSVDAFSCQW